MRTPEAWLYGVVKIANVDPVTAAENYTFDLYVTLKNVLGEPVIVYIVRVPFQNGIHIKKVPHHSDATSFVIDSWIDFPHGPVEHASVTYRITDVRPQ